MYYEQTIEFAKAVGVQSMRYFKRGEVDAEKQFVGPQPCSIDLSDLLKEPFWLQQS